MFMKSKIWHITWLEQETINELYYDIMPRGKFFPLTKTEDNHPSGRDFTRNYFTQFLHVIY